MEEADLEDLRYERGWGSEFKVMALASRSWSTFSNLRQMLFSLTVPSFLVYMPTVV